MKNFSNNKLTDLRVFGLIWTLIFLVISYNTNWNFIILSVSIFFGIVSFVNPKFFEYSKIMPLWIKFGDIAGKINSKIIVFIMFYFLFTPIGLILKLFNKDLLSKKLQPNQASYFKAREQYKIDMTNQF